MKGFYIAALSHDGLDVERQVCLIDAPLEGGAIVHYEGLYYAIGSALQKPWTIDVATGKTSILDEL